MPTVLVGLTRGLYHMLLPAILSCRYGHLHITHACGCNLRGSVASLGQVVSGPAINSDAYSGHFLFPPLSIVIHPIRILLSHGDWSVV